MLDVALLHKTLVCWRGRHVSLNVCGTEDGRPAKRRRGADEQGRRTLSFWVDHRHELLYPGAKITVLGMCYLLCDMKTSNAMRNEAFNMFCRAMAECGYPPGNLFPPSYYVVRGILACEAASCFERHMCTHCDKVFPDLPRAEEDAHATDECVRCGASRFNVVYSKCTPRKRFWDLGVANLIQQWMADPMFAKHLGRDGAGRLHHMDDPATLLGSPYGKMLDTLCKNVFTRKEACACFQLGAWSTTLDGSLSANKWLCPITTTNYSSDGAYRW